MNPPFERFVHICFHGVGEPQRQLEAGESAYWVTQTQFLHALDLAAASPWVRVSFDDGNQSDHAIGLSALLERGLTADFFVLAGRIGAPGSLHAAQIRELIAAGMRVGSHGMAHIPWKGIDASAAERELVQARERIAEVAGSAVDSAALPLGRYDRVTLNRLRQCGYRTVYSSDRNTARTGSFLMPRYSVRADDSLADIEQLVAGPSHRERLIGSLRTTAKRIR